MTQPLPNPTAKSAPADSAEFRLGNFFQSFGPRQESASFDSFLPREDWKDRADQAEETEEQRRKKKAAAEQVCCDATATRGNDSLLDSNPDIESLPAKQTNITDSETPQSDNSDASAAENPENVEVESIEDSIQISSEDKSPVADGMEVAPSEVDMVSLASIEDSVLSPLAPARDPLVTSSNRLSVAAALSERSAITAISASSGEGGNSASLQGNPNLARPQHTVSSKSETTATVLKNFAAELEKFRQSGQSQVQLELNVGENETVKVRLQMRADELRSTFITDSPELRDALQKAWPEFAQSSRDRGFRFGDPSFQNAYSQNDSPSQGRQGARDREANSEFAIPAKSTPAPRRAVTPAAARPALWA